MLEAGIAKLLAVHCCVSTGERYLDLGYKAASTVKVYKPKVP
jgi:hypothetical protein